TEHSLDLNGVDTSIDGLVEAINSADPSLGVHATVLNDGSENPHRLMLTSVATGTDAAVASIEVTGNSDPENALQALIGFESGVAGPMQEQAAANASLTINGIAISSQSNKVEDAIEGVTLDLIKTSDEAETLSITRDDSVAKGAINDFVTAYNN